MGNMEPESAISCNWAKLPMEDFGHKPSHKKLQHKKIFPVYNMCKGKDGTEIKELDNQLVHLETHAMKGSPLQHRS